MTTTTPAPTTPAINKCSIDARAADLGFTKSQVTPTIRMAIANMMVQENWLQEVKSMPDPAAK